MKSKIVNLKSKIVNHPQAALILLAFVSLAVVYSLVTPPFEAGDESRHYAVVKYIADTGRLPVQEPGELQIHASHEANQPPFYYSLAAAVTFWIETGDWDDVFWYNPHTTIGNPLRPDNKNITIHPPGEGWPWRGHVLAVHLIRFLSIAMAAVTVTATYGIALRLFKGRRWLAAGAMAITAFNPMFVFISASVNNDNAVIMFVTLTVWLMVQLTINNEQLSITDSPFIIRHSPVLLGLLIGLGALSKLYALGLLPLAGLLFLWLAYNKGRRTNDPRTNGTTGFASRAAPQREFNFAQFWQAFWRPTLTMLVVACAVAGWFYVRNAMLYDGDVLALQIMRDTAGQREAVPSLATIRAEFEGFRIAYWALFGGVNILADDWTYTLLDAVSLVAMVGLVMFVVSGIRDQVSSIEYQVSSLRSQGAGRTVQGTDPISLPTFAILLSWCLIMFAGLIVWNLTQPAGQGRLLYPAIAAISALGMVGLTWWLPVWGQKIVVAVCTVGLFAFATVAPVRYIAPAYAKPSLLTQTELPTDLQPVNYSYDGHMRLIGYQLHDHMVHPSERLRLTLYWQLLAPVDLNYSIFVHLLGREREPVGQIDTYPGGGKWPTTLLEPGDIIKDEYEIPIAAKAEANHAPTRLLIAAGIYDYNEPGRPGRPAINSSGEPVEPIIARAKLIPWQWPDPPRTDRPINFSDKVTLLSHQFAEDVTSVTLNWEVHQTFETDYTVFLQAWRADTDEYVTGFDGPPVQGYYPTSLWAPGEIIVDRHPLDLSTLSPGNYRLLAGLYNPITDERLPAFGPEGPLSGYAVDLGTVRVRENQEAGTLRGE